MASITTWSRLEPRPRGEDMIPSLEARVHDPAWMLGRQWAFGEFIGEDAASPIGVELRVAVAPIDAFRAAGGADAAWDGAPLDVAAGAEPGGAMTLADAAEAGGELRVLLGERGCSADGIAGIRGAYGLPAADPETADAEGGEYLRLLAGRLPDARALAPLLRTAAATGQLPAGFPVPGSDATAVLAASRDWILWLDAREESATGDAWLPDRLEHDFAVRAQPRGDPGYALRAREWDGDRLDWYDFDVDRGVTPPARPPGAPARAVLPGVDPATGLVTVRGLASPLTYPGMPARRYWEFEDAFVNFAQITEAKEDLARMLVVEFASVYANDWYLWPLQLPVGAVHRVERLLVTDTFGETTGVVEMPVSAGGSKTADWQLFRPTEISATGARTPFDGLVLLPTLVSPLTGPVFEEVRFLHDELANLAWAIETTVRGADGRPVDRHAKAAATEGGLPGNEPPREASDDAPLVYRFATDVPVYWFPLVPLADGSSRFRRLVMRRVDATGQVEDVLPKGALLSPEPLVIWQEEVPREGAEVTRRHHLARGADGALLVWRSRRKRTGRGEGSSGLRYDDASP